MNQLKQTKAIWFEFVQALSENRKINIRYACVLLPVAICLGAVCFINTRENYSLPVKLLQLLLFGSAGVLHLYFLKRKISIFWFRFLGDGLLYTSCAAILILISLVIFYSIAPAGTLFMAIASSAVFVLPHLILHAWSAFMEIPDREFPVWTQPGSINEAGEILFTGQLTFQLKVTRKYFDITEEIFFRTAPEQTRLGEVFFALLNAENKLKKNNIETVNNSLRAFAWEFYTPSRFTLNKQRRLDPERTLEENGIRNNSVVTVKRVNQPTVNNLAQRFSEN